MTDTRYSARHGKAGGWEIVAPDGTVHASADSRAAARKAVRDLNDELPAPDPQPEGESQPEPEAPAEGDGWEYTEGEGQPQTPDQPDQPPQADVGPSPEAPQTPEGENPEGEEAQAVEVPVQTHKFARDPNGKAWTCTCGKSRSSKVHDGTQPTEPKATEPTESVLVRKLQPGQQIRFRDIGDVTVLSRISVKQKKLRYLIGFTDQAGVRGERELWANSAYRLVGTVDLPEPAAEAATA